MTTQFYDLFIPIKKTNEIIRDAFVVIDTNVLLMAYQWRDMTFNTVYDALCELSSQGRLRIPNQVIKEFAKNRPDVIQDLYQDIHNKILSSLQGIPENQTTLDKVIPAFDMMPEIESIKEAETKYIRAIKNLNRSKSEYKKALQKMQNVIKGLFDHDPISKQFKELFEGNVINSIEFDSKELELELKRRKEQSIPPGYKDKGHKGDYLIWKEILSLEGKPVIFVTGDNKADWVHSVNDNVFGARRELVEEFYSERQETLKILTPLQFIEEYALQTGKHVNELVKQDLVKDTSKLEQQGYMEHFTNSLKSFISENNYIKTEDLIFNSFEKDFTSEKHHVLEYAIQSSISDLYNKGIIDGTISSRLKSEINSLHFGHLMGGIDENELINRYKSIIDILRMYYKKRP